jgi:hypothetical protein
MIEDNFMLEKHPLITASASLGVLMLMSQTALADGFAHWAKLNRNTTIGQIGLLTRSKVKHIPSEKELGVPVYPGMKIYRYVPADAIHGFSWNEKKKGHSLPVFYLASESPPGKVVKFYTSRLKEGYRRVHDRTTKELSQTTFVKITGMDAGAAHASNSKLGATFLYHPYVMIAPTNSALQKAIPGAQTSIYISYRP